MYILDSYHTKDQEEINQFIHIHNFADLITQNQGAITCNKVPFYFDEIQNTLYGHLGVSNAQLEDIAQGDEALVVFTGVHSYISPQWYESKNAVPTWNFQTLQCRGTPNLVEADELEIILANLTKQHESSFDAPWTMAQLDTKQKQMMLNKIIGFKISVKEYLFKEKMSQNRQQMDRESIIDKLITLGTPMTKQVATVMQNKLKT